MFVYVDESGDLGFRFRRGSSTYFVAALLIIEDPVPLHADIDRLKRRLRMPPHEEFKFSKSSHDVRTQFLTVLQRHDVVVYGAVIDKTRLPRSARQSAENFYSHIVSALLALAEDFLEDAIVIFDRSFESRPSQLRLGAMLRRHFRHEDINAAVRAIRHRSSNSDNLIQAVDMVSGAIYRMISQGDERYLRIISSRVMQVEDVSP